MNASSFTSRATHPALLKRLQQWIWIAVIFSFLLSCTITLMHFAYMNSMERTTRSLENFRNARIDMAKGFLYVSLSGEETSPFELGQGLALLQQSVNDYYHVTQSVDIDTSNSAVVATFQHTLDSFTGRLAEWKRSPRPGFQDAAGLRIAFYDLERQSERLDMEIRRDLLRTMQTQNRVFAGAIVFSIFLLTGICSALLLSVRAVRRSDQTLLQSEDRFSRAFHGVPVALAITRLTDGRIMDVNDSFARLFGYSKEEAIGNTTVSLGLLSSQNERMDLLELLGRNGYIKDHMVTMKTKEAAERWILLSSEPMTLSADRYSLTAFLDITQRKLAEDALVESKEKYQNLVDSMNEGLIQVDNDDRILFVNNRFCEMVGYTREELIGNIGHEMIIAESNRPVIKEKNRARLTGISERYEIQLRKRSGEIVWVNVGASPMKNDRGEVVGSLGVFTDITERIQYEKTLEYNQALLRETGRIANVGGWRLDLSTRIVVWNEIVAQIHDRDGSSSIGMEDWFDAYPPDSKKRLEAAVFAASSFGTAFDEILELVTVKGNRRWVRVIGRSEAEGTAAERGIVGSIQDVTIIKAAEELMRESEDRLFHAQKMESIGTLAAGIAHDFNNILGIMLGYADLMRMHLREPDRISHSLEMLTNSINRGASLVRQLLTFARKTATIYAPTNVNDIINELRTLFTETFPKTITIDLSPMPDLPEIDADATQLHQVVLNLCVNARDAMPQGGTLTIATGITDGRQIKEKILGPPASQYVTIIISDTGMGMEDAVQKRIFEPFFTTKEPGKGTGLGLAVVFGIIENHKGAIDVKSDVGKGTAFTLYLPVPLRELPPVPDANGAHDRQDAASGAETILLVEDEPMLRSLIEESLAAKGYTVLSAENGAAGFETYKDHCGSISAVISDVGLPGIDGIEMSKKILAFDPHAKIVLSSGYLSPEARDEMEEAGIRHFLQKPCPLPSVLNVVRAVIDEDRTEHSCGT